VVTFTYKSHIQKTKTERQCFRLHREGVSNEGVNIIREYGIHKDEETLVLWKTKGICSGGNIGGLLVVMARTGLEGFLWWRDRVGEEKKWLISVT